MLPGKELLRTDGEVTETLPRVGLTKLTHRGVAYCMVDTRAEGTLSEVRQQYISLAARVHVGDGTYEGEIQEQGVESVQWNADPALTRVLVCTSCVVSLGNGRVPEFSLVRVDTGLAPPHLAPLSALEASLVSLNRPFRSVILCKPLGSSGWIPTSAQYAALSSHSISVEHTIPSVLDAILPLSAEALPDFLTLVIISPARDVEAVRRLADATPALVVRGPLVVQWVRHLIHVINARQPNTVTVDETAVQFWEHHTG